MSNILPALFIGHGNPMNALLKNPYTKAWSTLGQNIPRPRAVLAISAHWFAPGTGITVTTSPRTIHDFGGFPAELYQVKYPAPGDPELARRVQELLAPTPVALDESWGLDHGSWAVLCHVYPQADVPVVQVALPLGYGPAQVLAMGRALRSLRAKGVLVIGSGSMTHNLREFFGGEREPSPYVVEFSRWVESAVVRGDQAALLDYRRQAPHAQRAHPSEDHFLPIFFALGATGWGDEEAVQADYLSREVMYGILAMDSFALASAQPA